MMLASYENAQLPNGRSNNILSLSREIGQQLEPPVVTDAKKEGELPSTQSEKHVEKETTPLEYLKSLFSRCAATDFLEKKKLSYQYSKPSREEIEAYDMVMVQAVRSNNVARMRSLLDEGKSFNACNQFGESLIHLACRRNDAATVRFLVKEAGVRVDIRDDFGRTPLHDACWVSKPNYAIMDLLLDAASPELLLTEDARGHTPFHYARQEHNEKWVKFLKEKEDKIERRLTMLNTFL